MRTLHITWVTTAALVLITTAASAESFPRPQTDDPARSYYCQHAAVAPVIDGALDDVVWAVAEWTEDFADISGLDQPVPRYRTRSKLLWDKHCLYIAAQLDEPQLQASFTEHDSYIYQLDNDFEVFLDPDGDTHNYFELEMNALNTVWDLLLTQPYRDNGAALHGWDFKGLRSAVRLDGTLNDASDTDAGWSIEIAIPWTALAEAAGSPCPPEEGDIWRLNFSRVQWRFDWEDGQYVQATNPQTGERLPVDNWVWSPPGLIAMHYPERWGYLVFCDGAPPEAAAGEIAGRDAFSHLLYDLYYCQRDYFEEHGEYACFLADLRWNEQRYATAEYRPLLLGGGTHYTASVELDDGRWLWLDDTGRNWVEIPAEQDVEAR